MILCLEHANVYTPDDNIADGLVVVADGRITFVGPFTHLTLPETAVRLDARGLHLVPGFIDLQVNGGFGHDFTDNPQTIWPVARRLPAYGVTSFLPTIITSPLENMAAAMKVWADAPPQFAGAWPLGLHLEGPFLHPAKKGAHNPAHLRPPDVTAVPHWSLENGVRLVTLAPELPGADGLIRALVERGVVVSAGHSTATFAEAQAGFAAGIRYGTHLFNAMPGWHHREPGLAGALLADGRLTVGFIADGEHVHPSLAAVVWRLLGNGRLNLITDAMAALGMPPGRYKLGDFDVAVDATTARLPDGTLAGCILSLDAALRNLMRFTGCTLAEALPTITSTPANLLNLPHKGRITPGSDADLVLLTPDLQVQATIIGGEIVYQRDALLELVNSAAFGKD